jgi:hypothetical protein
MRERVEVTTVKGRALAAGSRCCGRARVVDVASVACLAAYSVARKRMTAVECWRWLLEALRELHIRW